MKTLNVLLGSADRRTSNLIESTLLDLCYGQTAVDIVRMSRANDFVRQASCEGFDLILMAAEDLLPCASARLSEITNAEAAAAIRSICSRHHTPVVVVGVAAAREISLLEVGAVGVFPCPFKVDRFREEMRQLLRLSSPTPAPVSPRWSWAEAFSRGIQRFKQA